MIVSVQNPREVLDEVRKAGNDQGAVGESIDSRETGEQPSRKKITLGIGGERHAGSAPVVGAAHDGLLQGKGVLPG